MAWVVHEGIVRAEMVCHEACEVTDGGCRAALTHRQVEVEFREPMTQRHFAEVDPIHEGAEWRGAHCHQRRGQDLGLLRRHPEPGGERGHDTGSAPGEVSGTPVHLLQRRVHEGAEGCPAGEPRHG